MNQTASKRERESEDQREMLKMTLRERSAMMDRKASFDLNLFMRSEIPVVMSSIGGLKIWRVHI